MEPNDLAAARQEIDQLDVEIVGLLNQRAKLALRIGAAKNASQKATYAPDRDHQVLEHVKAAGTDGPLTAPQLTSIYRQVMAACRSLERPLKIAYMGPALSWTHQAAMERFGESAELVPATSIPDTFTEVQRGTVDFGVVPIENSTDGQ